MLVVVSALSSFQNKNIPLTHLSSSAGLDSSGLKQESFLFQTPSHALSLTVMLMSIHCSIFKFTTHLSLFKASMKPHLFYLHHFHQFHSFPSQFCRSSVTASCQLCGGVALAAVVFKLIRLLPSFPFTYADAKSRVTDFNLQPHKSLFIKRNESFICMLSKFQKALFQ